MCLRVPRNVPSSHNLTDLSILLVEPSRVQSKIIMSRLQQAGNDNVEGVGNIEEAWSSLQGIVPDLVISSMYLPDATGTDLVGRMREDSVLQEVPFMLISSENRWENLEPIRQAGVIAILPKPFEMKDLKRALDATIQFVDPEEMDDFEIEDIKVLVVDDSSMSRRYISRIFENMGIEHITTATNGTEAVKLMEESLYDLVLTDFNMPEMDGERLTEHIRNRSDQSTIPILMVTAEQDSARLESVRQAGVSAICNKPFDSFTVKSMLAQLLGGER